MSLLETSSSLVNTYIHVSLLCSCYIIRDSDFVVIMRLPLPLDSTGEAMASITTRSVSMTTCFALRERYVAIVQL